MTSSLLFWSVAAVLAFWGVGAYNRLVRLRSEVNAAFTGVQSDFERLIALVAKCVPPEEEYPVSQFDGGSDFWAGLQGAGLQLNASLQAARAKPLDPERMAALGAAHEVFHMAWDRAERDDAHDLAGSRLPADVSFERTQLTRTAVGTIEQFNQAVARYNDGVGQFPASVLAWLFGFKPARGIRARG